MPSAVTWGSVTPNTEYIWIYEERKSEGVSSKVGCEAHILNAYLAAPTRDTWRLAPPIVGEHGGMN